MLQPQDSNIIGELISWSRNMVGLRQQAELILARYFQNRLNDRLPGLETQLRASYPHLTPEEVASAVAAVEAVLTALGNDVSGQVVNLIKMLD